MHPLTGNLSELTDQEIDDRLSDLSKKYYISHRLGKPELLTQIENAINIYKEERNLRYQKQKLNTDEQDLDDLINVD